MDEEILTAGLSNYDKQFIASIDSDPTLKISEKDMLLFNRYLQTRNKYVLTELVNALMPVALKMASKYNRGVVADGHFKALVLQNIGYAIQSYDSSKGASLGTHVGTCMQRLMREMTKSQNMVNMGEQHTYNLPKIQNAAEQLREQLGRDPSHDEIANHYNQTLKDMGKFEPKKAWTGTEVGKLLNKDYSDHYESNNAVATAINVFDQSGMELKYVEENLTPDELKLFNLIKAEHKGDYVASMIGVDTNGLNYRKKKLIEKIKGLRQELGKF